MPGAVLTRVASSHIRVGTFQFFAARGDTEALRLLADHVIARHYPEAGEAAEPYRALFEGVIGRQAALVAKWLLVGFIAFFGFSQGAVIWVYISEIFPTTVRAKGQSLGSFTHWAMNAAFNGRE